jgi:putative ABC transport system permease protein
VSILTLIKANLIRNKTRTILTLLSIISAFFLFTFLDALNYAFTEGMGIPDISRLIVRNRVSITFPLPLSYYRRINSLMGVKDITYANWFGGVYKDRRNFFPQIAVKEDTFFKVYNEFIVDDNDLRTLLSTKNGAIVGKGTADRFGFKKGDLVHLIGTIYTGMWEFKICGIYVPKREGVDNTQFIFRYDYLHENMRYSIKDFTSYYVLRIKNPDQTNIISKKIDALFENSSFETITEDEKAFTADYVNMMGNIKLIMISIGTTVLFSILLVVVNTMMMAIRERTHEIAIEKVLGFSNTRIIMITIMESVFLVVIGGLMGMLFSKVVFSNLGIPIAGASLKLVIEWKRVYIGSLIAVLIGILTGTIPAINAVRLKITDALRSIQ